MEWSVCTLSRLPRKALYKCNNYYYFTILPVVTSPICVLIGNGIAALPYLFRINARVMSPFIFALATIKMIEFRNVVIVTFGV